jgi:hypothetical protein
MARKNKQLQEQSIYDKYDLDGDGVVSDEELKMAEEMRRFENEDEKADAQRKMAWFALLGMLLYPAGIFFTSLVGLDKAAELVADIASVYFVSVAAIVAAFFGASALNNKK